MPLGAAEPREGRLRDSSSGSPCHGGPESSPQLEATCDPVMASSRSEEGGTQAIAEPVCHSVYGAHDNEGQLSTPPPVPFPTTNMWRPYLCRRGAWTFHLHHSPVRR